MEFDYVEGVPAEELDTRIEELQAAMRIKGVGEVL